MIENVQDPEHGRDIWQDKLNGASTASRLRPGHDLCGIPAIVDLLTLALTHGLMAIALWRLLGRPELDEEDVVEPRRPWARRSPAGGTGGDD
jgi:hypothetical protein